MDLIRNACYMAEDERDRVAAILSGVLRLGRRLRAERETSGVSLSGIGMMSTLLRMGPMPAARLAAQERLQPQSLTRIVAGLEGERLIERHRNPVDRRESVIALTDRGRQVLSRDMAARRAWLEKAMAEILTDDEREALLQATAVMLKLAGYEDGSPPGR